MQKPQGVKPRYVMAFAKEDFRFRLVLGTCYYPTHHCSIICQAKNASVRRKLPREPRAPAPTRSSSGAHHRGSGSAQVSVDQHPADPCRWDQARSTKHNVQGTMTATGSSTLSAKVQGPYSAKILQSSKLPAVLPKDNLR